MLKRIALIGLLLASFNLWSSTVPDETSPVLRKVVIVQYNLYKTNAHTTIACGIQADDGQLMRVQGCVKRFKMPVELHATVPKNWCDINRLDTLGHEVMHVLGRSHSPEYTPPYIQPEAATGCTNGDWFMRATVPRP